jgi:hypothetical protein
VISSRSSNDSLAPGTATSANAPDDPDNRRVLQQALKIKLA